MKKTKSWTALLLALCFLSPSALLIACREEATNPPNQIATDSIESVDDSDPPLQNSPPPNSESAENAPSDSVSPPKEDSPSTPTVTPTKATAQYIKCTGNSVNIRSGAGTDYTILGSAEEGTTYAVIGKTGNWYKTYYKNKVAYLYASYTSVFTLEKTNDEVEEVIEEGYKLLGVPYVYGAVRVHDGSGRLLGGFTTQKFDCSSLIQYIFYKASGKLLGVHTRAQVVQGEYVAPNDLQRGDCIFFTNEQRQYNKGLERVGHVALYLGDGYILHTASDYARIEKISKKRWSFYIEARRFL